LIIEPKYGKNTESSKPVSSYCYVLTLTSYTGWGHFEHSKKRVICVARENILKTWKKCWPLEGPNSQSYFVYSLQ